MNLNILTLIKLVLALTVKRPISGNWLFLVSHTIVGKSIQPKKGNCANFTLIFNLAAQQDHESRGAEFYQF